LIAIVRRRHRSWIAIALLTYVALSFALCWSAWRHPGTTVLGGEPDNGQHVWFITWTPFALMHGQSPLESSYINYPDGVNMMWNTGVPLLGTLAAPLIAIAGPVVALNLMLTLAPTFAAFFAMLAIRRFVASPLAAAIGGLLFGFSPYVTSQTGGCHTNLATVALVPVFLLVLDDVIRGKRRPALLGIALGLLAAAQLLISEEVLATVVVVAAIGLVLLGVSVSRGRRQAVHRLLLSCAVALPVFAMLSGYTLWVQFFGPGHISAVYNTPGVYVTDLANLVVPPTHQAIAPAAAAAVTSRFTGNSGESTGYLGIPLLVVLLVTAVRWWREPIVRAAAILAGIAMLLSMGPSLHVVGHDTGIPLPWRAFAALPLLDNVIPGRLTVYAFLLGGLLVAIFVDRVRRSRPRWLRASGAILVGSVLLALAPAAPLSTTVAPMPRFFSSDAVHAIPDGSVALILPLSHGDHEMLWQAVSGMRYRTSIGGWFFASDGHGHLQGASRSSLLSETLVGVEFGPTPVLTPDLRRDLLRDVRARYVGSVVVVDPGANQKMVTFMSDLLGRPPRVVADVDFWSTD
jgi:hypothetical protein